MAEQWTAALHMFQYGGKRLVYDVNSGSLHEVDELAWELIKLINSGKLEERSGELMSRLPYPGPDVKEALAEIKTLEDRQLLFSPSPKGLENMHEEARLKALCLFISANCNLQCRYCFAKPSGDNNRNNGQMSRETAFGAVDLLLEQDGGRFCEIDFFGGEPLLNFPLIREIVGYATEKGLHRGKEFTFTLTTNGMLLGEDEIRFLNETGMSVILSLDGRPEIHDRMRRTVKDKGSYDLVLPRMHKLLQDRGYNNYYVRGTYTSFNLDFCRDVEHLLEAGFDSLSLEPVVAAARLPYGLGQEDIPRLEQEYDRLVELFLQRRREGRPFHFYHFDMDLEKGPCIYKRLGGCGAGGEYLAVAADGSLYPCHHFVGTEAFRLGKLGNGTLELDRQKGSKVASSAAGREECSHCWARYLCGGGCAAASYFLAGDLGRNDPLYCALQRMRMERALYLQAV